jgi:hypothetical protein
MWAQVVHAYQTALSLYAVQREAGSAAFVRHGAQRIVVGVLDTSLRGWIAQVEIFIVPVPNPPTRRHIIVSVEYHGV